MKQIPSEYQIKVTFHRSWSDDLGVLDKEYDDVTNDDLIRQFRKELQLAYDNGDIAGSFQIDTILREGRSQ